MQASCGSLVQEQAQNLQRQEQSWNLWHPLQVKPQYFDSILEALKPHILPSHLIISIAAGIRLANLEASLPEGTRVVSQL